MTTPPDVAPIGDEALDELEAFVREGHEDAKALPEDLVALGVEAEAEITLSTGEALAIFARLRGAEARQQWRPISDAPRDGTNIDVWVGGEFPRRIADVSWREPTDSEWWVHGGDTIDVPDATWFDGFGPLGRDQPPTHWLPLPPQPEGAA